MLCEVYFFAVVAVSLHALASGVQQWSNFCPTSINYFAGKALGDQYHIAYGKEGHHVDDCPVRKENIHSALDVAVWEQYVEAFARIGEAEQRVQPGYNHKANVFIIGGSMTTGATTDCDCLCVVENATGCPGKLRCDSERLCSWVGHLKRWLPAAYKHTEFAIFDFSEGGLNSMTSLLALGEKMKRAGVALSSNDIVFIDESVNDSCSGVPSMMRYFELLVRTLLSFSGDVGDRPTIVVIEQYPHRGCGAASRPFPNPRDKNDVAYSYRHISKQYGLMFISLREVYWSYFGLNSTSRSYVEPSPLENRYYPISPYSEVEHVANHPPWYVHVFVADVIAASIAHVMQRLKYGTAVPSKYLPHRNAAALPAPFYSITTAAFNAAACDIRKPYTLDAHPNTTFHPANVKAYETDLPVVSKAGWRQYADHHDTAGWIINELANPDMRTLVFNIPDIIPTDTGPRAHTRVVRLLKVTYLTSYEGMGTIFVTICGLRLEGFLDGLHAKEHVSVPTVFVHHLSNDEKGTCENVAPEKRTLTITYVPVNETARQVHHNKFKIMDVEICTPQLQTVR